ncbi:phosphohistidine phosphatase SixA [Marinomonas aquiplantarum]|nr:phosphohistidine phosphatase SixA [Marinomonas aquiplantarum]
MMKPKRLYVLRHGNAAPYCHGGDELRELTDLGVAEVKSAAQSFMAKSEVFDRVFVSPYVRAQQTAKIFLAQLDVSVSFDTTAKITPSGQLSDVVDWLQQQDGESILLVTHQPFAQQLVEYLSDEPLPLQFAMTTATMAALEGDLLAPACCQFRWYTSPR